MRARRPLSAFSEEGRDIIRALAAQDNRLVVISYDDELGEDVAEVAHEALIREWKKLQEWVSADPLFLQWLDATERRLWRYLKNGKRPDDLLQGIRGIELAGGSAVQDPGNDLIAIQSLQKRPA